MTLRVLAVSLCAVMSLQGCNCGDTGKPPDGGADAGSSAADAGADAGFDAGFDAGVGTLEAAVLSRNGDVLLLRLDGGTEVYVPVDVSSERLDHWPRWHPDGTRLAYTDDSSAFLREADGGITRIPKGVDYFGGTRRVEWSPDGTRLALDGVDAQAHASLFLLPLDGGVPELVDRATQWAWLGNDALVYSGTAGEGYASWVYSLATQESVSLMVGDEVIGATSDGRIVSPYSQTLADGGSRWQLLTLDLDGGAAVLFPGSGLEGTQVATVVLSPYALAAAVVVFDDQGNGRLLRVSAAGVSPVLELGSDTEAPRCLRFVRGRDDLSFLRGTPEPSVFLASLDGGLTTLSPPGLDINDSEGCLDWRLVP